MSDLVVNPLTNRKIKKDGKLYQKLQAQGVFDEMICEKCAQKEQLPSLDEVDQMDDEEIQKLHEKLQAKLQAQESKEDDQ